MAPPLLLGGAALCQLREIGDDVLALLGIGEAGKRHFRAGNIGLRRGEEFIERCRGPDQMRFGQRRRIGITRHTRRRFAVDGGQARPEQRNARGDRMTGGTLALEDLLALGGISCSARWPNAQNEHSSQQHRA